MVHCCAKESGIASIFGHKNMPRQPLTTGNTDTRKQQPNQTTATIAVDSSAGQVVHARLLASKVVVESK